MKHGRFHRFAVAAAAAAALLAGTAAVPAHASAPTPLRTGLSPFGANDWNCKPSAEHPAPVVLVHATGTTAALNWINLSPMLADAGYCVFAFDYGATLLSLGLYGGIGDIPASARTMADFVDRVLRTTGAEKVDVVGHSQGGMMPNYYLKRLGGADKVRTLIGLSPSNHGTTSNGLGTLAENLRLTGWVTGYFDLIQAPAFGQQSSESPFMKSLFADGDTVPGIRYVVIQTAHDKVITPYTNAFLQGENVTNILIQDQCPGNPVGHIGMFADGPTMQNVLNALGPNVPNFQPACTGYGPPL
ncbi:alpha/beta fold hydrolase [Nocardia sp. NPDC048505]|uniref:esterase/lipase family protein n=1 Tax=Nocardia sp. NPDC048505 TaxID=3155756 RepID=UPI0033FCB5C6